MFIGHFAVGFAAKRWAPKTSLAVLLAAPMWLDIVWPVLILAQVEKASLVPGPNPLLVLHLDDFPWSHSLLMSVLWGGLGAALTFALSRSRAGAAAVGLLVPSHWVLDWITHRPDMPVFPGGSEYGLQLWASVPATLVVEGAMFVAGVALYLRATRARNRRGALGMWTYVVFLLVAYAGNLAGPPPPSMKAIGISALIATVVLLTWAWWFDRNREPARLPDPRVI